MKIKKRYTPYVIIVIIILVIAAVTAIICISNSRKSKYHGLKSSQELEKEYFDAFRAEDYDRLYELTYIPYINAVVKNQGMGDSEAQIKDYYKLQNQKLEAQYGDIKTIKKKESVITDMSLSQLDAVNGEFEYLGVDAEVSAGAYIELTIIYECEKENTEVDFDYYAIAVEGEWYFYSTELAPFVSEKASEEVTNQTEDEGFSTEHSVEFVIGYGTDRERVILTQNDVKSATATISDSNFVKEYIVQITFNDEGTRIFAEETAANIGEKITILCDGEIVMAPVIQSAITDGITVINNFNSLEEAQSFADMLK